MVSPRDSKPLSFAPLPGECSNRLEGWKPSWVTPPRFGGPNPATMTHMMHWLHIEWVHTITP